MRLIISFAPGGIQHYVHYIRVENGLGVPIPQVGDEFFIEGMEFTVTIASRRFIYDKDGSLHVLIIPTN